MSFPELKILIKLTKFLVKTNKTIKLDNLKSHAFIVLKIEILLIPKSLRKNASSKVIQIGPLVYQYKFLEVKIFSFGVVN